MRSDVDVDMVLLSYRRNLEVILKRYDVDNVDYITRSVDDLRELLEEGFSDE